MYDRTYDSTLEFTILFYEVTILYSMIRMYFFCNTNFDRSYKGHSCSVLILFCHSLTNIIIQQANVFVMCYTDVCRMKCMHSVIM